MMNLKIYTPEDLTQEFGHLMNNDLIDLLLSKTQFVQKFCDEHIIEFLHDKTS